LKKPNFFIVGQVRSGTTTLTNELNQHPDVFIIHSGSDKIPAIFGFPPIKITESKYLKAFVNVKNERMVGDKCTDYMICSNSAEKIKKFSPDAKIIINLRNPVDCMYSYYNLLLNSVIEENITDFKEALKKESSRLDEEQKHPGTHSYNLFYKKNVHYYEQIKRYLDNFGEKNVHIRIFEEFVRNPKKSFKEVCNFLEIDSNFEPNFKHSNANRKARNRLIQQMVMKTGGSKLRNIIRRIPFIRETYNLINLPNSKRDRLDPDLRKKLLIEFRPEIDKLSKLLKKDLSFWYNN
jgi:hypothetical protein